MLKVVWSPEYLKYDFGPDHPFWAGRGAAFLDELKIQSSKLKIDYEVVEPPKATDEDKEPFPYPFEFTP